MSSVKEIYKFSKQYNELSSLNAKAELVSKVGQNILPETFAAIEKIKTQQSISKSVDKFVADEKAKNKKEKTGYTKKPPLSPEEIAKRERQKLELQAIQKKKKDSTKNSKPKKAQPTPKTRKKANVSIQQWKPKETTDEIVEEVDDTSTTKKITEEKLVESLDTIELIDEEAQQTIIPEKKTVEVPTPAPKKKEKKVSAQERENQRAIELKRQGKCVNTFQELQNKFLITNGRLFVKKETNDKGEKIFSTTKERSRAWWQDGRAWMEKMRKEHWDVQGYYVEPVGNLVKVRDKTSNDPSATKMVPLKNVKNDNDILFERQKINGHIRRMVWEKANQRCEICGKPLTFAEAEVDHIDSIVQGGFNTTSNYQCSCTVCNQVLKNALSMDQFKQYIVRIVENQAIFDPVFKKNIEKAINK